LRYQKDVKDVSNENKNATRNSITYLSGFIQAFPALELDIPSYPISRDRPWQFFREE
jgi:predicted membrane channel-forming protein YqfA (hemolysin III family)